MTLLRAISVAGARASLQDSSSPGLPPHVATIGACRRKRVGWGASEQGEELGWSAGERTRARARRTVSLALGNRFKHARNSPGT